MDLNYLYLLAEDRERENYKCMTHEHTSMASEDKRIINIWKQEKKY